VDRIGGILHQHHVSRADRHQHEVGEPLLGPDDRDRLVVRVELDSVAALIPLGDGGPQVRQPLGRGVAVVSRILRGLDDLRDDVGRGRQVRIPHPQVDDVLAGAARGARQVGDLSQDVGRKSVQLVEIVVRLLRALFTHSL
jgi:hypothetical protein